MNICIPLIRLLAYTLLLLCTLSTAVFSQIDPVIPQSRPLETLLNQDGTFAADAGYNGTVDARGWQLETDITGRPRFVRNMFTDLMAPVSSTSAAPGDENWADLFKVSNLDGDINAMVAMGSVLFVGGSFKHNGVQVLNGIARLDASGWTALYTGLQVGVNGSVLALAISGNDVYVGGRFSTAGGVAAANIARWSEATKTWSAVGGGVIGAGGGYAYIGAITVRGSSIYVGGNFATAGGVQANNVAEWIGGTWKAIGIGATNGVDGDVVALATLSDTLYVGGSFTTAGGTTAHNIVSWNITSQTWIPMIDAAGVNGLDGYVNVITVGHGLVYIGGSFIKGVRGSIPSSHDGGASNIIRWTGTRWLMMGRVDYDPTTNPVPDSQRFGTNNVVRSITIVGDSVYVGGTFRVSNPGSLTLTEVVTSFVARWDNHGKFKNLIWAGMRTGTGGYVNAMTAIDKNLYVGGSFQSVGGVKQSRIARWNIPNAAWSGLTSGPNGQIYAVGANSTDVYATGVMATPEGASGYYLARWGGTMWHVVSTTVDGIPPIAIYAMAVSGDNIYVGGLFSVADKVSAVNVARYNTKTGAWSALGSPGSGVGGGDVSYVTALAVRGNDVYVGGSFTIADDIAANNIARFDGTTWHALGNGVSGPVFAIGLASNGDVYVGGDFNTAGTVLASRVAHWNGSVWSQMREGVNDFVNAITVSGSSVYVGGDFTMAGNVNSRGIAEWNGTEWKSMDGGVSGGLFPSINAISVSGSSVYACGSFTHAGTTPAANIARWDGTKWNSLGSGTDDQIRASVIKGNELYVAGDFNTAGGKSSFKFGLWTAVPGIIVPDADGSGGVISAFKGLCEPITDMAAITFATPLPEDHAVTVHIYDHLGRLVAIPESGQVVAATYQVNWDRRDVPAGVYYCRMECAGHIETRAVIVGNR